MQTNVPVVKGILDAFWQILEMQIGVCHRGNVAKNPNASVLCVFCAALRADQCASGKTDLSRFCVDCKKAMRF